MSIRSNTSCAIVAIWSCTDLLFAFKDSFVLTVSLVREHSSVRLSSFHSLATLFPLPPSGDLADFPSKKCFCCIVFKANKAPFLLALESPGKEGTSQGALLSVEWVPQLHTWSCTFLSCTSGFLTFKKNSFHPLLILARDNSEIRSNLFILTDVLDVAHPKEHCHSGWFLGKALPVPVLLTG